MADEFGNAAAAPIDSGKKEPTGRQAPVQRLPGRRRWLAQEHPTAAKRPSVSRLAASRRRYSRRRRQGIRELILPKQNEKNVKEDLTEELRRELTIHYVAEIADAVKIALKPSSGQTTTPMPLEEHQTV